VALSPYPLLSRQLIVGNPPPRHTAESPCEPFRILALSLVEAESLLVLETAKLVTSQLP
jgi:hypothetical protein